MKRPYRAGDRFAIPIAGGRRIEGLVLEAGGSVATLGLIDGRGRPAEVARVEDRALVLHRWPVVERGAAPARAWPALATRLVDAPETFADRARALADGVPWVRPRVVVRDGATVEPLPDPRVLCVVGARTQRFDAAAADLGGVLAIDLAGVTLERPAAFAREGLRVARLTDVRPGDDLEWLAETALTHLYLRGAHRARSLEPLARMRRLRHLEIRGAWQIGMREMAWREAFGHLDGFTIDVGSRRKNAEIYRGFAPPYPEPFERALERILNSAPT